MKDGSIIDIEVTPEFRAYEQAYKQSLAKAYQGMHLFFLANS
jgi:hypothetical protein